MAKITATGKRRGEYLHVVVEDGKVMIDGEESEVYDYVLKDEVVPIGGTFYPEPGSMMNIHNNLQHIFFDDAPKLKVEGDIGEIPYEEGFVY
ncbi:hypothetical protein LMF32_00920 [Desemzia sp. C1]|uniref:hypothetical protein n=1 Tax=Desemzia sp. C1 TaxID=2892016 RepID=UPI001E47558F|nr:hypothetical protein [Desemzia sp. C1]MCI3027698.1 hypothetical protein [Desemzia sp. C1]